MSTDSRQPFDRQPGESAKAYNAFTLFRDLAPSQRSIRHAWLSRPGASQGPGSRSISRWRHWSARWGWLDRAAVWDADVDAKKREKWLSSQLAACERHQRAAAGAMQVCLAAVRASLNRLADPHYLAALETLSPVLLLREARASAQILPQLAAMERLALGLTTATIEVDDRRTDQSFGDRVTADPTATDLAIRLLDQLAGSAPAGIPPAGQVQNSLGNSHTAGEPPAPAEAEP
jgi:hypothetical protein